MPHQHFIGCNDDGHLNYDEIRAVNSPVGVNHKWSENVHHHTTNENQALIKHLKSEVVEVHEWSSMHRGKHSEARQAQVRDDLEVDEIAKEEALAHCAPAAESDEYVGERYRRARGENDSLLITRLLSLNWC